MKKKFFLDFFPPPDYMLMPAVGFDISDRSVKYVEFSRKKGVVFIERFGERIVPPGMIEAGEIKERDKLIEFLKPVREELKTDYLVVALPEEKAFLAKVKLPMMKESEIRSALETQLEEHVPLLSSEAVFDFEIIKKGPGANMEISLIAFPRQLVEDYRVVFKEAGFLPLVFEMEIQSSARAVVPREEKGTVMLVDFGRTRVTFAIINNTKLLFTSTAKVGGNDLEKALMKTLGVDAIKAQKIKKECGLVKSRENEKNFDAILPTMSVVKDEMKKWLSYWDSHSKEEGQDPISKVFLSGGDSNLLGLLDYLSYELKLPVELANPWINIFSFEDHVPEIELRESLVYANALGLALRANPSMNLVFSEPFVVKVSDDKDTKKNPNKK